MAKRRPTVSKTPADEATGKKFPNGIRVLAQSLWQYWPSIDGTAETPLGSIESFKANSSIDAIARLYDRLYPGDRAPVATAHKAFNDVGAGRHRLRYFHLRYMAELVSLPVGLLLVFAQFISAERRARKAGRSKSAELLSLISDVEAFAAAARAHVLAVEALGADDPDFFITRHTTQENTASPVAEEYLADLGVLRSIRDAVSRRGPPST